MSDYLINIFIPIILTFLFTFIVGFERQNIGKAAGISAHVIVSVAACGIAILQRELFASEIAAGKLNADGQRVIAQVIAGIGFLGAGIILKTGKEVKGLTTASTIWFCAMLGLILGMKKYDIGITMGVFIVIFLYFRDIFRGVNPFKNNHVKRVDDNDR